MDETNSKFKIQNTAHSAFAPCVLDLSQIQLTSQRQKKRRKKTEFFSEARKTDPEIPRKIQDILSPRATKEDKAFEKMFVEEKEPAPRSNRWSEALRMVSVGVSMVFILNIIGVYYEGVDLKSEVVTASYESYTSLLDSGTSLDQDAFQAAAHQFKKAQESLWFLNNQRAHFLRHYQAAANVPALLGAGHELSLAAASFAQFAKEAENIGENMLSRQAQPRPSLTQKLETIYKENFKEASSKFQQANQKIQAINTIFFPKEFHEKIIQAKEELTRLNRLLEITDETFPFMLSLLGNTHPQRYLVLLENNDESRPGGGFIGSYLLVDINDGYLDDLSFHDIFEIDGQFHEMIPPPLEMKTLTNQWGLRDSNYSPDGALSSAKAAWFLQYEGGPSVDHVVTVDLEFARRMIEMIGPIEIENDTISKEQSDTSPYILDSKNFRTLISYTVESKLNGEQKPKQILENIIPVMEQKLREKKPWLQLLSLVETASQEKHIMLYSAHEEIQALFEQWGVTGTIPKPEKNEDQLGVIHTAIGGNKTDAYVKQNIDHTTWIDSGGEMINEIKITRKHEWSAQEEKKLEQDLRGFGIHDIKPWVKDILGAGPSVAAMRVYVPTGTELIEVSGINRSVIETLHDIDLGMDYFYFQTSTYPGRETTVALRVRLPFELQFEPLDEYRLRVFKQPGDRFTTFKKTIHVSSGLTHYRSFPEDFSQTENEETESIYTWETPLNQDLHVAQLWGE